MTDTDADVDIWIDTREIQACWTQRKSARPRAAGRPSIPTCMYTYIERKILIFIDKHTDMDRLIFG